MVKIEDLLNKTLLVGIRIRREGGEEFFQTHGIVEDVEGRMLRLRQDDGSKYLVGFSAEAFQKAAPGVYREKSTGAEITDPDYLCAWVHDNPTGIPLDTLLREGFRGFVPVL